MKRFVEEADRGQWTLLPECLDDFIDESNPVRVIDVFVDALDLAAMSFEGVEPAADRQEPTEALAAKVTRLTEKLTKLKEEMGKLAVYEMQMLASPDQQISLSDPDSRSMATSGRGSGVVGYNVQVAVDTDHHLIIAHEVTNTGSDR